MWKTNVQWCRAYSEQALRGSKRQVLRLVGGGGGESGSERGVIVVGLSFGTLTRKAVDSENLTRYLKLKYIHVFGNICCICSGIYMFVPTAV